MDLNQRLPQVDPSHFAMVPRSDVPRSRFRTESYHKTTFDVDYLIPIYVREVLPGSVLRINLTLFARVNNLIFPLMDNLTVETFGFFTPDRLTWGNFEKFMGAQANPGDSIAYTTPQLNSPAGGFAVSSLFDYFGLPTVGQVTAGQVVAVSALPIRADALIYNAWFKDQNLQNAVAYNTNDGPDSSTTYVLKKRNKKHDYFTSALPWPLKGGIDITLPLGGQAVVKTNATDLFTGAQQGLKFLTEAGNNPTQNRAFSTGGANRLGYESTNPVAAADVFVYPSNLYADLTTATGATINAMRLAIASQQFLEKDARGGTRYTEILRNHFGVTPEDSRLDRPEYIGGGISKIRTNAIPQTSATGLTGGTTPAGSLSAQALVADRHTFSYHATEHGTIIIYVNVTGDITYQQGLHRMWTRQTRFDRYWPTFANLGEQAIRNDEIYCTGTDATDTATWAYQERWAEYRYEPSKVTGLFRSTSAGNIDEWHLSQQFTGGVPPFNAAFIQQSTPMTRALAAGASANGMHIIFDSVFDVDATLPIPTYSIPGLTRF